MTIETSKTGQSQFQELKCLDILPLESLRSVQKLENFRTKTNRYQLLYCWSSPLLTLEALCFSMPRALNCHIDRLTLGHSGQCMTCPRPVLTRAVHAP